MKVNFMVLEAGLEGVHAFDTVCTEVNEYPRVPRQLLLPFHPLCLLQPFYWQNNGVAMSYVCCIDQLGMGQ